MNTFVLGYKLKTMKYGALVREWPRGYSVWNDDPTNPDGYRILITYGREPSNELLLDLYDVRALEVPPKTLTSRLISLMRASTPLHHLCSLLSLFSLSFFTPTLSTLHSLPPLLLPIFYPTVFFMLPIPATTILTTTTTTTTLATITIATNNK